MNRDADKRWQEIGAIWEIIDRLRGESGCPWDRKQTPRSVQTYLVEEAHEAAAAVRSGRLEEIRDELGDVLFMVLFLVHLHEEQGDFRLEEVCQAISEKMIRRHPHVFGDAAVHSAGEVRANWEKIKADEKRDSGKKDSGGVPASLPALVRAYRILSRQSHHDPSLNDLEKQRRELARRSAALEGHPSGEDPLPSEALGRVLSILVNLGRIEGLRAEDCLHRHLEELEGAFSRERN